jgi:acyl-CoA thioester hydrolase
MADAFTWRVRVYYEDTDTGGIVFYANYLKFFERARTEWLRSGGIDQSVLAQTEGIMFVVMRTAVDYHVPATLDNELNLSVTVERRGRASVEFLHEAWRLDPAAITGAGTDQSDAAPTRTLIATGRIKVACVDQQTLRPKALPARVRRFIEGEPPM